MQGRMGACIGTLEAKITKLVALPDKVHGGTVVGTFLAWSGLERLVMLIPASRFSKTFDFSQAVFAALRPGVHMQNIDSRNECSDELSTTECIYMLNMVRS